MQKRTVWMVAALVAVLVVSIVLFRSVKSWGIITADGATGNAGNSYTHSNASEGHKFECQGTASACNWAIPDQH